MPLFSFPPSALTFQRMAGAAITFDGGTQPIAIIALGQEVAAEQQLRLQGAGTSPGSINAVCGGATIGLVSGGATNFDQTITLVNADTEGFASSAAVP